ncbi:hypothetical protein D9Y22_12965 [Methylorubrum sp. DB1722]|nr:hypothetical protein [Methylorubrum sp. DB1722]
MSMPCQLQHPFDGFGNLDQQPVTIQLVLPLGIDHLWLLRIWLGALSPPQRGTGQKRSARWGSGRCSLPP